jgi:hypothetical protein
MGVKGLVAAVALAVCVAACDGPKGEPGPAGPAGERATPDLPDRPALLDRPALRGRRAPPVPRHLLVKARFGSFVPIACRPLAGASVVKAKSL